MSHKVLIFKDFFITFPLFAADMHRTGAEVLMVASGTEVLPMVRELKPAVVLLDVAMPEVSGIECCRQIKREFLEAPIKVVLVTAASSSVLLQRAEESGCDLLLSYQEAPAKLVEFVLANVELPTEQLASWQSTVHDSPPVLPQDIRKVAARVEIPGVVTCFIGHREKNGWSIDASRTGILFAVDEELPAQTEVRLRFTLPDGRQFDLSTVVVRSIKLRAPVNNLIFGAGARFVQVSERDLEHLTALMESRSLAAASKLSPELLKKIFVNTEEILSRAINDEETDAQISNYIDDVIEFEKEAFCNDGGLEQCVRQLVVLRTLCTAFRMFLPTLKSNSDSLAPDFLPMLDQILERADAIETDVDLLVRNAVSEGDRVTREGLNDSSNRLYQAKLKLLYAVDESIKAEKLLFGQGIIGKINQRVGSLHELVTKVPEIVKYNSRRPTAAAPLKTEREKEHETIHKIEPEKKSFFTSAPGLLMMIGFAVLIVVGIFLSHSGGPSEHMSELKLQIRVVGTEVTPEGLVVKVEWGFWKNLPKRTINEAVMQVQQFLEDHHLLQASILDEAGKPLLLITGEKNTEGKPVFSRREYRR